MASNFKPWVDSPTAGQQVQSAQVFATDAQRADGFKAGDPASALRVNSALRQANIVVAGLMQMCDDIKTLPDNLSLMSTVTQVKNAIKAAIDQLDATTLASAKSYTDTRERVINGKITNVQNQVTSNKNRLDALEPRVDDLENGTPETLSNFVVKGRQTTNVGWHKAMEIKAANIGNVGGAGYSAIVLVNGVRGSIGESVTPAGSSIIEIVCRADSGTNGVFLAGFLKINILNGWLNTRNICVVSSTDNTTISVYINIEKQFMQYNLTKLSEGAEGVENVNALTFVDQYYGSSAPTGAIYGEILNNAGKADKADELTYLSVGTTATFNNNWYEIARVPVNATTYAAFSVILLLNGRTIGAQMSGIIELEGRGRPNNWTYKNFKVLCGNLASTHIAYYEDDDKTIHFYLYAPSTTYGITKLSSQINAVDMTFPLTELQPEELPAEKIFGANFNYAGYDSQSNYIPDTYAKIKEVSNPNILINPDFYINQRGQTSYSATTANTYTVDRVRLHHYATPTLTPKTNGGISVTGTSSTGNQFIISYYVEDYAKYAGKTLTFSIKISNVTGTGLKIRTSSTGTGDYSATISSAMLYTKTFTVDANATELSIILATGVAGAFSFDIDWWKLEVGSVATAFVPPLRAEELLKCQRYYCKYTEGTYFYGLMIGTDLARINILFPVTMRMAPTMTRGESWLLYFNGTSCIISTQDSVTLYDFNGNAANYKATITGGADLYPCVALVSELEFDAEIY